MSLTKSKKRSKKSSSASSQRVKQRDMKGVSMLITPELLAELAEENRPDEEIDTTDMPEITDFKGAVRGPFYRAFKESISIRVDADVLAWFRTLDEPYQTRINQILRQYMEAHLNKRTSRRS